MPLTYPTFTELDTTRFEELKELLKEVLQSYNPNLDLRRGTLNDLVLHSRSLLTAVSEEAVQNGIDQTSLTTMIADPSLASDEAVDRVLGNYRVTRNLGTQAEGEVTIIITALLPVVIPSNFVITVNGVEFVTDQSYAARTSALAVIGPGDKLLTAVTGGYAFNVGVIASGVGENGNVSRASTATLSQNPPNFLKAFAASDFTGGTNPDSNEDLLNKLASGMAVRAWSNRPSIEAVIRQQEDFTTLKNISVIGYLDPEMLRDAHSLFPVSAGGRADLYARTALTYQTKTVRKTATLISKVGSVGTWQFGLTRDDASGFYEIAKVLLPTSDPTAAGFIPSSDTRAKDVTGTGWKPDIPVVVEGVYSYYQTTVIQFADNVTDATALSVGVATAPYDAVIRVMPYMKELQEFWNSVENRPPMCDVLVKAPIPCFTDTSFTVNIKRGYTVSSSAIKSAVSDAINNLGFSGRVAASYISQVLHNLLGEALYSVGAITINGRIRNPDGTATNLTSTTAITVADNFAQMVSGRTVAFFADPTTVSVTVTIVDPPSV